MSFLAPWALLLAAAAGLPLLLHLLRRRTGEKIDFPAVRYLMRMEREHAREVRLKNLLLMVLRVAIIVAIALAAARPLGWLPGVGHAPTAVAIVIDNSLSSAAAGGEGPMIGRLGAAARGIVDASASGDRLWLLTMDGAVIGGDAGTITAALSGLRALDGAGDAAVVLRRAATLVKESAVPTGRIVVLTDAQATTWAGVAPLAADDAPVTLIAPGGALGVNRAVIAVATEPRHWDPRGTVRATVAGPDSTSWRVVVDGRTLARGTAQAGATVLARVQPPARGWVAGTIELAPDELRGDDARHFAAHVGEPPAITVDAAAGPFLRGAVEALVQGARARRGEGVLLASAERARRPALLFAPGDPLKIADANRALERAGIPWRFGAKRLGPAPLRGQGVDGATAQSWYLLESAPSNQPSGTAAERTDTLARVGGAPWAVAGEGYVLVASAAEATATDLPVRAAFLPWLDDLIAQRLVAGTVGVLEAAPGGTVRVPALAEGLEAPDGTVNAARAGALIDVPWLAGVHFWRRGTERVGALVVNPEPGESALERLAADSLARQLGATSASADPVAAGRAAFSSAGSRALARTFLLLALLLLVAETLVARRGSSKPAQT
ncbi:MAG: VWA domain-containing protein [Gemmatimonadetes bacterium]|nr:VWA domain-containing protein [Gemmatimonadota bacterium]